MLLSSLPLLLLLSISQVNAACVFARGAETAGIETPHDWLKKREAEPDFADVYKRALNQTRTLIGDLRYGITTPVGQSVANIILGQESGQQFFIGQRPLTRPGCAADKCCWWYNVGQDLVTAYNGCSDLARQAIRAGFHDAATWSLPTEAQGGGADGSLILATGEIGDPENQGLELMPGLLNPLYQKYKAYGIGMADLLQYASNHAVVTCTLGPRVRTFVGRKDSTVRGNTALLPKSNEANSQTLIKLFADKTFVSDDLVALIGAHSTGKQFFLDPSKAGMPFDQSPGVWDRQYYIQVQQATVPDGVYRLPSDAALARDPNTNTTWFNFGQNQQLWDEAYATAYVRMSMLGVNNINNLTECTQTLPPAKFN